MADDVKGGGGTDASATAVVVVDVNGGGSGEKVDEVGEVLGGVVDWDWEERRRRMLCILVVE